MAEILQPRAEEIFSLIQEEITRAGFSKLLNAGVVLMGGGSLMPGMTEVAEQTFELPVRMGQAGGAGGLAEPVSGPQHAMAIGLALYGARNQRPRRWTAVSSNAGMFVKMGGRVRAWFSEMF
jgi:cell division protein FtsA